MDKQPNWVEVATAMLKPQPPPVIVIYCQPMPHAEADRLADLLKKEGFTGEVVVWVGAEDGE